MTNYSTVGKSHKHDNARQHVSGSSQYIDDKLEPFGTLHIAPGYAAETCGTIESIDLSAVKAAKGVVCVLTAADIPNVNDCSPAFGDDPIFAVDEITFHGQVVFAVVAKTRLQARHAAQKAKITVAATQPIITAKQGAEADSHILPPYNFSRGDADKLIKAAPNKLSETFLIGGQEQFYLEGQISLAVPKDEGEMIVYSGTQHPAEVQHTVAKMLGLQATPTEANS